MHENTQIAHQPQAKPAALDNMNVPVPELSDLEPGLNQWLPIQLKLSVGAPDDPLEYEADAMADKVMRMPETSFIQRKSACSCSDYDDEHVRLKPLASQVTPFIQAKGDGAGAVSDSVSNRIQSSMGGGQQLDGGTKSFMESRFGADFSDVKIHNGGESAELNQSLNAKAFTVSNNIYFNSGQYQPQTDSGKHLLAHELTHVVQQGGEQLYKKDLISQPLIQKQTFDINNIQRQIDLPAEDLDVLNHPIDGVVKASIFQGLVFYPSNSKATYKPGSVKYLQGLAATVKALTGEKYSPDLVTDFIEISTGDNELIKYGGGDKAAKENEPFKPNSLIEGVPLRLINFLLGKNIKLKLSSDQIDIIQAYVTTDQIYEAIKETAPKWFTRNILALLMLNKKTWLSKYASLKRNEDLTGNLDKETSSDYYIKIEQYVFFYIDIIEAVRTDSQLVENPSYRIMWKLQSDKPGAKIQLHSEIAGPNNEIDFLVAAEFIQQCNTDISDAKKAIKGDEEGHKARQRLLKDTISTSVFNGSKKADTTLSDKLNRYNAPPLPSSLQCFPPLGPPLFELVANTSPTFLMSVEWGDIYEALGFAFAGSYGFELIRINDDVIKDLKKMKEGDVSDETAAKGRAQNEEVKNIAEDPKVKGENPGVGGVITQKLHQRVDYFAEDVDTVFGGISAKLGGDPGVGTLALDAVGSVFGAIGDVISSFWQKINAPRGERKIPIDKPGLYVIRAIAFQADISETASFVRAPSVAWMPVWARSAEDMAAKYGDQLEAGREVSASKLQDVNKELLQPNLDPERKKGLQKTKEALTVFLYGSAKETLDLQKRELEEALLVSKTPEEKESIKDQLKETNRIIETEKKRLDENKSSDTSLESPFEMTAVFISDDGSSRQILFELIEKPKDGSDFQYFVSDLSSSKSSSETGPLKNTREDAIQSAIEEYLDEPSRYGRGYCSIYIPPRIGSKGAAVKNTFRVKSDAQAIVLDSVENIASALSVILIAAAPFTGGASLALMLPIGIIGAIPSAYRLYDRAQGDSFHLDYGTAMDLVNVVTSFTGLGGEVAGKLKWVTVGKGFAIVGLGMNGLGFIVGGAQTLDEIDNISKRTDLSPGTRKAMIMSAIGGQLQAAGLMVGAHLVESSKALRESNELEAKNAADSAKPAKTKGTNDVDAAKPARDTVPAMPHSDETVTPAKPHATTKDTLPIEEPANVPKIEKKTPVPKTPKPTDETKANQPEHKPGEPEVKGKQKVSENDPEIIDLPAGSVMKGADPHNAVETAQMYRRSINDSPKREAAIYHNPTTNEFIVIQGDEGAAYVEGPGGTQEGPAPAGTVQKWKEILDGNDTGSWELTAHYHPG
ncbi:MAG: hypothetical protein JWR09_621, partial [Mucilaginibacter sp.]|nr:hypothetical protein [Mucilaginibacter sp.]